MPGEPRAGSSDAPTSSARSWRDTPEEVWRAIEQRCARVTFDDGDVVMHHGSAGRSCYAVVSGSVLVTATSTQGSTLVIGRRGPGDLIGELAALEEAPRTATVTAQGDVVAHVLRRQDLLDLLDEYPAWAIALLQQLARRLRSMTERFALRSEDLRHRIAEVLVTNYDATGDPAFRSTREELASWVGATREATARTLQQMQADGLVTLGRGVVSVADRTRLAP
ncbi:MAG: Crp/Fnr family transcriptional regulator [Actinomycetota bacterium]